MAYKQFNRISFTRLSAIPNQTEVKLIVGFLCTVQLVEFILPAESCACWEQDPVGKEQLRIQFHGIDHGLHTSLVGGKNH